MSVYNKRSIKNNTKIILIIGNKMSDNKKCLSGYQKRKKKKDIQEKMSKLPKINNFFSTIPAVVPGIGK